MMAPVPDMPDSLSVSALLDELLAERAQHDALEEQEQTDLALSADDQQQLAALHDEVDGCLASLERWQEERRARTEQLEKELEAQYGFSCQLDGENNLLDFQDYAAETDFSRQADNSDLSIHNDVDSNEPVDMSRYLGGAVRRPQHGRCDQLEMPPLRMQADPAVSCVPNAKDKDAIRLADSERLEQLRAEVESMRHREASGLGPWDDMHLDDPEDATVPGMSALTNWCDEVDSVLEDVPFNEHLGGLAGMQERLHEMDAALSAAHTDVDADLNEMEKLLAECNEAIASHRESLNRSD